MKRISIILMFLATTAIAQQAPVTVSYMQFEGGINNASASIFIDKNESPSLMNVVIDEPLGSISQRKGLEHCGHTPSGNTATNLYEFIKIAGTRTLIVTDNENIWSTSDCSTYVLISSGHNAQDMPRFATINDNLWIVNGNDYPGVWNGSTLSYLDGAGGRPLGPIGKYIVWWKSRVWIGNLSTQPSDVAFSAVASPTGQVLNPATSTEAWSNLNNVIYFNRGDGSQLYGLKVYRDALYAFKETGISRLVFQTEYNLNVVKNVTTIGTKFNESIVEMDDSFLRFAGRDGYYKFDGSTVRRTSSKWEDTYLTIQQPNRGEQYKTWSLISDWATGVQTNLLNPDPINSISLTSTSVSGVIDDFGGTYPAWSCVGTAGDCPRATLAAGKLFVNGIGWVGGAISKYSTPNPISFRNLRKIFYTYMYMPYHYDTTDLATYLWLVADGDAPTRGYYVKIQYTCSPAEYTGTANAYLYQREPASPDTLLASDALTITAPDPLYPQVNCLPVTMDYNAHTGAFTAISTACGMNLSYTLPYQMITGTTSLMQFDFTRGSIYVEDITQAYDNHYPATGSFVSAISTHSNLSVWKTFNTVEVLHGGTIDKHIRLGNTLAEVGSATWQDINSGDIVSTSTEKFSQWMADLATTDPTATPTMNSAAERWVTGFPTKSQLTGINYKSKYWSSVIVTSGSYYNDRVIVESRPPIESHTFYDLPISAITLWNNNLYGSISGTSKIARLDYTESDDGVAITSYWNSRDEVYNNPLNHKSINKIIVDYSRLPVNPALQVGLSYDFGTTYSTKTFNTGAYALARNTKTINPAANRALQFRVRLFNNTLGAGFKVLGVHAYGTESNFMGN